MPAAEAIALSAGPSTATVLPGEGGVLVDLRVDGREVLSSTPWAGEVAPGAGPAATEDDWVRSWRGGWQLCLPTAGQPDPRDPRQGFHGAASQAPWTVTDVARDAVTLTWAEPDGLVATREWRLTATGVVARGALRNDGDADRSVILAEHLILGGDVLAGPLRLETAALGLQPLDYDGRPAGPVTPWPGAASERWDVVDAATPARVAGLVDARAVTLRGDHVEVEVAWTGLAHALVWAELGVSRDEPWAGAVRALGIEPSSRPHGAGTALGDADLLAPGVTWEWESRLDVRRSDAEGDRG